LHGPHLNDPGGLRLYPLALLTGLLPFLCVHLSYLLAAGAGHVPWCVPYWDSCTSISATGRELPEKLLFKLLMMPAAMLALGYWWAVRRWLQQTLAAGSPAVQLLGSIAAAFLMLYVVALGENSDYRWARQSGIILFFSLSFLAHLCFLLHSNKGLQQQGEAPAVRTIRQVWRWQWRLALLMLGIGVGSVLLDLWYARYDDIEDAVEWLLMLGLVAQFCSHAWLWRATDLRIEVRGTGCKEL